MTRFPLPTDWALSVLPDTLPEGFPDAAQGSFPATVPGCVHTDLLSAGVINDPYLGQNELETRWIGRSDWCYTCTFAVSAEMLAAEHLTLVCEGLDTVAEIRVNGEVAGTSESMHVGYRFELKPLLRAGENTLEIVFFSPYRYAEAQRDRLGHLPGPYDEPYNFIRKMACNFGWDWGPILVTAGIWRDIYLEAWSGPRFASVRPLVRAASEAEAVLEVALETEGDVTAANTVQASLTDAAGVVVATAEADVRDGATSLTLNVTAPQLWWPRGHGAQPLYTLVLSLGDALWQCRVGLRTTELETAPDDIGAAFTLKINGKPIFCKGANWIPDDCFMHRVTPARYRERLTQAADAHMNMLRVWGGGIYEDRAFYDSCDELGLLVWQDFLFACAAYPEEAPFDALVEAEARYNLTRLAPHPSLVLWNGNNENLWGYVDWGWQPKLEGRSWGRGFYLELLPRLAAELDPSRPYWPGSPYTEDESLHPNVDTHGPKHIWDVWNQVDYTHYRDYRPRFASEFGFQAPPTYPTLARSIPETERFATSPAMLHHQKAIGGNDKLAAGLTAHFGDGITGTAADFGDWLYLTQLNQARAVQLGVEWYRLLYPRCAGTLYWQLNDCWPVTSWAAVDGDGRPKPLWFASQRFFADQLLTFQPEGEQLLLRACNDSDEVWAGEVVLQRLNAAGEVLTETMLPFWLEPRQTAVLSTLEGALLSPENPAQEFLAARTGAQKALWFFVADKDFDYPLAEVTGVLEGDQLTLSAGTFVRDIALFVDRLAAEATISDQLITLLPGESYTLTLSGLPEVRLEDLLRPPVFNCANRFGRKEIKTEPAV